MSRKMQCEPARCFQLSSLRMQLAAADIAAAAAGWRTVRVAIAIAASAAAAATGIAAGASARLQD